jgi:hypothetical protein
MAKADDIIAPPCELTIRIQLRKYGLRLERSGLTYQVFHQNPSVMCRRGLRQADPLSPARKGHTHDPRH